MPQALPYRDFNSYLQERFGERVQKIALDAGLSCPNREQGRACIYCNQRGSGSGAHARGQGLADQIEETIKVMRAKYGAAKFLAYFQSYTNTHASLPELERIFGCIRPYAEIVGLAIGTRPDCIDSAKLDLIARVAGERLVIMEYGLQTANDATLARIQRGHDVASFIEAVELTARQTDFRICGHAILGLPGETEQDYMATARLLASLPVTDVKLHLLYVCRDTPLAEIYESGGYAPLELADYTEFAAKFVACLRPDQVVQRLIGVPQADDLIAPRWLLRKQAVRANLLGGFKRLNLSQGCSYAPL